MLKNRSKTAANTVLDAELDLGPVVSESKYFKLRMPKRKHIHISLVVLIGLGVVAGLFLSLSTARATQTLTWTTNADFSFNKVSECAETNIDDLEISGAVYNDADCSDDGEDAALSLTATGGGVNNVLANGNHHSLALKSDGTVWGWGMNSSGQLGNDSTSDSHLPIQVKDPAGTGYLSDIVSIAAGGSSSIALKSDGTVWAWGDNSSGQLGDNTTSQRNLPIQVKDPAGTGYLSGVTFIAMGVNFALVVKDDGTAWAWGNNDYGQLGDNSTSQRRLPIQVKDPAGTGYLSGVSTVAGGSVSSLALKSDGTVWGWGRNFSGEVGDNSTSQRNLPVQVKDSAGTGYLSDMTAIAAGYRYSLALKSDGTVWAWGEGGSHALGNGSDSQQNLPVQVKDPTGTGHLSGMTAISGSLSRSMALRDDGTVWAWGDNSFGQIGDNTTSARSLPVQVKDSPGTGYLTGITALANGVSFRHSLALKNDGTVWAWGTNGNGQLGDNTTSQRNAPVQVKDPTGTDYLSGVVASSAGYVDLGVLSDIVVDIGAGKKTKWYSVGWQTDALPDSTSVTFNVRTSNDGEDWSAWSSDFIQSTAATTSGFGDIEDLPMSRFIEIRVTLATTDNQVTPVVNEFSLSYMDDQSPPEANASDIKLFRQNGGLEVASGGWINSQTPYFSWEAATDSESGVQGYCLYIGQDDSADPVQTKGLLGDSPLETGGACPYAVTGPELDLSLVGTLASELTVSNDSYYLVISALDYAGNVYADSPEKFEFHYDNIAPTNPAFISAPSQFVATKDVTMTWPTSGGQAAVDTNSGVAGLQYKIGSSGTWYGAEHNGNQDITDVLPNNGSYQTNSEFDYPLLAEGNNIVYFRTIDNAGNVSASSVTAVVKLNTSSPTSPQNLVASPTTNTTNSFAFSWQVPESFVGPAGALTYCYTVNTLPALNTCTYTPAGATSLAADAFATQPGENIIYVVARDEAGNINYATYASATFTANTPAPGIARNFEIADVSTKSASIWRLALSWTAPEDVGAGVARYAIFRSTDGTSYSQIATTSGLSYVDGSLSQVNYYYKVRACDSANNCGAFSEVISQTPTGRFTTPPEIVGNVSVEVSTRKAVFTWTTDRDSDSRVQYGTESGVYLAGEVTVSQPTKSHTVELFNLEAGTTYYYKVKWMDEDGNTGVSGELSFTTLPAPTVKNVEVVKKTLSGALIQFTTTDSTKADLYYGKTDGFGGLKSVNTSTSESTYIVELVGLDDGSTYYYKLGLYDQDGNQYDSRQINSFATPERPRIYNLRFQPVEGEPTSTQQVSWNTNIPATSILTYGKEGTNGEDMLYSELTTEHSITIRGLEDDSQYFLLAQSRDADGNLAVSDRQTFRTALDTRPPKIYDVRIETSVKGYGGEARGQMIVSWKTDEPATSQVAYADGSAASGYTNRSAEDARLTLEHVVIISDLAVSKVYNLQPISKDRSSNSTEGENHSAIIGRASESVLNIILNSIQRIFGI